MLAIVLSRRDIREFDQIISLFCREMGKMSLFARGINKSTSRNSSSSIPFTLVHFEYAPGREFDYLTSVVPARMFAGVRCSYERSISASIIMSVVDSFFEVGEVDYSSFALILDYLFFLENFSGNPLFVIDSFVMKLLSIHGVFPELARCVVSGVSLMRMRQVALVHGMDYVPAIAFGLGGLVSPEEKYRLEKRENSPMLDISYEHVNALSILNSNNTDILARFFDDGYHDNIHDVVYMWYRYVVDRPIPDWKQFLSVSR
jgi:hypothetical protein